MKNDNQAAVILFSDYSDMMLTDEELLSIHGGATDQGGKDGSTASPPPAAPPPAAPAQVPQVYPVTGHVEVEGNGTDLLGAVGEVVSEVGHIIHEIHNSDTVQAVDHFLSTAINSATSSWFGESGGSGGSGG